MKFPTRTLIGDPVTITHTHTNGGDMNGYIFRPIFNHPTRQYWDAEGLCDDSFMDSLISTARWNRLTDEQRFDILALVRANNHIEACDEFLDAERINNFARTTGMCVGLFVGLILSIIMYGLLVIA